MKPSLLFYPAALLVVATSPVWFSIAKNELEAYRLLWTLSSTKLPDGATYKSYRARVANFGNSDGCDYEAKVLVAFNGDIDDLARRFVTTLKSFPNDNIYVAPDYNTAARSAKAVPGGPELYIRRMIASTNYEVSLVRYPRALSPDFRCW